MKKIISYVSGVAIAFNMLAPLANAVQDKAITVELDGAAISFDVKPQIINGRTMVPLRKIFEEIGALVKWDGETKTVTARKSSKTITFSIDSSDMLLDKGDTDMEGNPIVETITLDVPAQIVSDRTLVPTRAISEAFGLDVDWDDAEKKVTIISDTDEDETWKENTGTINLSDLSFTGKGITITDNQILITSGGDFTLTGTLEDGNITVSSKEKVKLRFDGISITSSENPCIFFENADKGYITVTEGTKNSLIAQNSDDGAIYSKDNLEIKGNGTLDISSLQGHAIKASDNLTIENGVLNLNASNDGIHINETFKMTDGNLNITSTGDGIDSESIVIISGGNINIQTNGVPTDNTATDNYQSTVQKEETKTEETKDDSTQPTTQNPNHMRGGMMWEEVEVEFEKSSKGINADWMMSVSGGEITVNSASHAIHCKDEIAISGGSFNLSSTYEKGISAHGNLTIDGSDTLINVTKSTEGLESKNIFTINDGTLKIISSDDGINATGGQSGAMMGGGGFPPPPPPMPFSPDGTMITPEGMPTPPEGTDFQGFPMPPMPPMPFSPDDTMITPEGMPIPPEGTDFQGFPMPPMPPMPFSSDGTMITPEGMPTPPDGMSFSENNGQPDQNRGRRERKDCLIINGGDIEIIANDDCLDANGNMLLNKGTVKAIKENGSFTGPMSVFDADGTLKIGSEMNLIGAGRGGNQGALNTEQNMIIINSETTHTLGESITLKDSDDNTVLEYTPNGSFSSVLIISPSLIIGNTYKVLIGDESHEISLTEKTTTIGTQANSWFGGNRPGRKTPKTDSNQQN